MGIRRYFLGLFAGFLLCSAALPAETLVRTAYYLEPGLCEKMMDGSYTGATIEYLSLLAKQNNWKIAPVFCTYSEALDKLERGEIDLLGGVIDSLENRKRFVFTTQTTGLYTPHLFVHINSRRIPSRHETWNGIEIALGRDPEAEKILTDYLKAQRVKYTLRFFPTSAEALTAFLQGRAEAILAPGVRDLLSARRLVSFPSSPLYFCTPRNRPDLAKQLEEGLRLIKSKDPSLGRRIYYDHFPIRPHSELDFSSEERNWISARIASQKPILVDLTPGVLPFTGWNEKENRPIGLVSDLLRSIGAMTGLTFEFIKPSDIESARSRYLHREIDFWAALGTDTDDLPGFSGGISLATFPHVLLTRRNAPAPDWSTMRLGVPSWDPRWQDSYRNSGVKNLVPLQSLGEALEMLDDGELDATAAALPQAILVSQQHHLLHKLNFTSVKTRMPHHQRIVLTPATGVNPLLISVISKCLNSFTEGEISSLTYHAVSESMPITILSDQEWLILVSGLALLAIAIIIGISLFFNLRLSRALVQAKAGERARANFLATMSHEIRTPLNAVIGFSEFLSQPDLTATNIKDYATDIFRSSHVLLALINDVLDLSKLEAGKVNPREGVSDFALLRREFLTIFASKVHAQGINLIFEVPHDFPRLRLSPMHLRQILLNLIGNAVKFTHKGFVTCTIQLKHTMEKSGDLIITVSDTGIGIAADRLESIFNPFEQDISMRGGHVYEGTGLGLPIVKRIAEAAGGSVSVTSLPGAGSTFRVYIPQVEFAPAEKAKATPPPEDEPALLKIPESALLVDDVPLNLTILREHVKRLGIKTILTAKSGQEALQVLESNQVEIVLTDVWMPQMDGPSLAKNLRQNPKFADLRIVAVTADVGASSEFDMTPFDAILTKPVTRDKLLAICGLSD